MATRLLCMIATGTSHSTTAASSASSSPQIELSMSPPARTAARKTSALNVSTEIAAPGARSRTARTTGIRRRSSSSRSIGSCPGRVDSAPMSSMSAPAARCSSACATASSLRGFPSPENESGVALMMPMRYVRSPQTKRASRISSGLTPRTLADIGQPPVAQRRDHEGRARHDDDVRSVGVTPRDTQGLDRIGDRPRRDPFLLRDVEQPLRTRRRPARRFERSKDERSGQLEERAQHADRVLHLRKRYDEREAPLGKRFGESLSKLLGLVGIVRDVENDARKRRKEFHAPGNDQPREGALHLFDAGSGLGP